MRSRSQKELTPLCTRREQEQLPAAWIKNNSVLVVMCSPDLHISKFVSPQSPHIVVSVVNSSVNPGFSRWFCSSLCCATCWMLSAHCSQVIGCRHVMTHTHTLTAPDRPPPPMFTKLLKIQSSHRWDHAESTAETIHWPANNEIYINDRNCVSFPFRISEFRTTSFALSY